MAQDQIVNALAEVGHEVVAPDIERAQLRMFSARAAYFMSDGKVNGEGSDPTGLLLYENVRVLPKAPTENARSRARRSHDKNWLVCPIGRSGHFSASPRSWALCSFAIPCLRRIQKLLRPDHGNVGNIVLKWVTINSLIVWPKSARNSSRSTKFALSCKRSQPI